MKFRYQAKTKEGETKYGQIEAFSKEAAIETLQSYGLYPTLIEEVEVPFYKKEILPFGKISLQELVAAFRQLAISFSAGVPIVEALNSIARESRNLRVKEIFFDLAKEVEAGSTLSGALNKHSDAFPNLSIAMVKSGEVSGELAKSLETIADTLEKNYYFVARARGALIYPAIVFLMSLVIFLVVIFYLLPKLVTFSQELEVELPGLVKFLLNFSSFLKEWWILLLTIFIGSLLGLLFYVKTPRGKESLDHFLLVSPIVGNFLKMAYISRIGANLTILISSGVPIAQALEITEEITGNAIYKRILSLAKDAVRSGESVSGFFKDYPEIFPPFFSQMVATGEKTGTLTKTLLKASEFYEKETERLITNLTNLLTPILVVIMGGFVGLIIFVILMTIYKTFTQLY